MDAPPEIFRCYGVAAGVMLPSMSAGYRIPIFLLLLVLALFLPAGRWDLPFFWAVVAVYGLFIVIAFPLIPSDLRKERLSPGPGGTDRQFQYFAIAIFLLSWVLASLDVGRFHWSDTVPRWLRIAGLLSFIGGLSLALRAMLVNRFFSPLVRLQRERGHVLVTTGPYQYIRHPGYLGALLGSLGASTALGSWWALLPLIAYVGLVLRRIFIEEKMLNAQLDGYAAYTQRVRFRLLPGLW